jgi:8-amino-3,8-dideoxy-alpha-D-manno-octulosonate transaminase
MGSLKNSTALNKLNPLQEAALLKLKTTDFSVSDAIMSRCISTAIGLTWTEEQTKEKGEKMVAAIKKALSGAIVGA